MIEMRADTSRFRAAVKKAITAGPEARRATLIELAREFGHQVMLRSPVYTGRFKRAEAQALNAAGVGPFPVEAIRKPPESKWSKGIARGFAKQRAYWQRRVNEIVAAGQHKRIGKKGKQLKGQTKEYTRAQKQLRLAIQYQTEWYASGGTAAVINRKRSGYNQLTKAYATVYGGTGSIIEGNGQAIVQLRNREPHARIVESKKQVRRAAQEFIGRDVLRKVGPGYVKRIAGASGMAVSA